MLDVILLGLVKLALMDIIDVLSDILSALINRWPLQVGDTTLLVFIFVVGLPLIVYSIYYLELGEKFFFFLEGRSRTNLARRVVHL